MRALMSAGPGEAGDFDPRDEFDRPRGYTAEELQRKHERRVRRNSEDKGNGTDRIHG